MEQLAKITGVICFSVLSMGMLYSIGHFPATEKVIRFVIAVYIILTCFKSADTASLDLGITTAEYGYLQDEYTQEYLDIITEQTQKEAEQIIRQRLDEKNISYNHVSVHILEQNDILAAKSIVIRCDEAYTAAARECIKDFITEETKIIIGE